MRFKAFQTHCYKNFLNLRQTEFYVSLILLIFQKIERIKNQLPFSAWSETFEKSLSGKTPNCSKKPWVWEFKKKKFIHHRCHFFISVKAAKYSVSAVVFCDGFISKPKYLIWYTKNWIEFKCWNWHYHPFAVWWNVTKMLNKLGRWPMWLYVMTQLTWANRRA